MDMNLHWVKDRVSQKEFLVFWQPGHTNIGDYATKHHSPDRNILVRPIYLHVYFCLTILTLYFSKYRGCVEIYNLTLTNYLLKYS